MTCHPANGAGVSGPQLWSWPHDGPTHQVGVVHRMSVAEGGDQGATIYLRDLAVDDGWGYDGWSASRDLMALPGNPLVLPLRGDWPDPGDPWDSHCLLLVWMDSIGRVYVAGNVHADPLVIVRTVDPLDVEGSWELVDYPPSLLATGADVHTYLTALPGKGGTVYLLGDQQESGGTAVGRDIWLLKMRPGDDTFVPALTGGPDVARCVGGVGATPDDPTDADRTYLQGHATSWSEVDASNEDRICLAGHWRYDTNDADTNVEPFYIESNADPETGNHDTWLNADGDIVTVPTTRALANSQGARIPTPPAPAFSRNWGNGMALDEDGRPHIILQDEDTTGKVRLTHDGEDWSGVAVTAPGSALCPTPLLYRGAIRHITVGGTNRVELRRSTSATGNVKMGEAASTSGGREFMYDPVAWRHKRLQILVPDGDEPKVWSPGVQVKMNLA